MISIVMPAHNEEMYLAPAVEAVVSGLVDRGVTFEVIIAENGSTDATPQASDDLARLHAGVRTLHLPVADYGNALKAGFIEALGETVVNFDVDFVDLEFLDRALLELDHGRASIVVGSKRAPGSVDMRGPLRRLITSVFSFVLRHGFGLSVTDTHGIKAMRKDGLVPIVARCRFGQDVFDTELILRAERAGMPVIEIPVAVTEQRPPRTPIWRRIPRSLVKLARLRAELWRSRGPDPA